jgi:hypothetical protein
MEGHIEGEGRAGTPSLPTAMTEQNMPSAPFPCPDDERLRAILREVDERFAGGEPIAAALFASGLAYQAGLEDGSHCPGCAPRAGSGGLEPAARIRAGQLTLTLSAGVPCLVDPSSPDKMG